MAATAEHRRKHFLSTCADFIHPATKSEFKNFGVENDHLDTFLQSRMAVTYPKEWLVIEVALLL